MKKIAILIFGALLSTSAYAAGPAGGGSAPLVNNAPVSASNPMPVVQSSAPLPTGAATAANQTAVQSSPGTAAGTALTVQGSASGVALPVVPSSDVLVSSTTGQSALNTDLLTETVNGWYDARAYRSVVFQLIGSAGITAGAVTFEWTNDPTNAPNGNILPVYDAATATPAATSVALTVAASTVYGRQATIGSGYIRARISTAFVGGTVRISASLSTLPLPNLYNNVTLASGGVAEDAATTAAPVIVGCVTRTALPASTVIAGDAVRCTGTQSGQIVTVPYAPRDLWFSVQQTITTATQTAIRAAQAAGIRSCITAVIWQNTSATATLVTIQDGASTTLYQFNATASMAQPAEINLPTPICGTAATALNYTAGTTGSNVLLTTTGYNSY